MALRGGCADRAPPLGPSGSRRRRPQFGGQRDVGAVDSLAPAADGDAVSRERDLAVPAECGEVVPLVAEAEAEEPALLESQATPLPAPGGVVPEAADAIGVGGEELLDQLGELVTPLGVVGLVGRRVLGARRHGVGDRRGVEVAHELAVTVVVCRSRRPDLDDRGCAVRVHA